MQKSNLIGETVRRFPDLGAVSLEPITKGGSDRSYFRVHSDGVGSGMILMAFTEARPDNAKFVPATRLLESLGVSVPAIRVEDPERRLVWLEDIGSEDLWSYRERAWEDRRPLYFAALDEVAKIHRATEDWVSGEDAALLEPPFDEDLYGWEQGYFFEHFVGRCTDLDEVEKRTLESGDAFASLSGELAGLPRALVHRDFQSENVLVRNGGVYLIDYQGLRFGLPEYDVASLVYDPYVRFSGGEREELLAHYEAGISDLKRGGFRGRLAQCAAQRLMQALGAYGNLGLNLGKPNYLRHIGPALENLAEATAGSPVAELGERISELRGRLVDFGGLERGG